MRHFGQQRCILGRTFPLSLDWGRIFPECRTHLSRASTSNNLVLPNGHLLHWDYSTGIRFVAPFHSSPVISFIYRPPRWSCYGVYWQFHVRIPLFQSKLNKLSIVMVFLVVFILCCVIQHDEMFLVVWRHVVCNIVACHIASCCISYHITPRHIVSYCT